MQEIRLGTIGSGFIVQTILNYVTKTKGIRLEAVYSRTQEKGNELAEKYGAKKVYTDIDTFFADEDVNVVYIASPNLLHYPQAKKALLNGKHVILEKPFTTKLEHAKELMEIAKEKHLMLVDAVPTICLPNFHFLKEQLSKIGKIKLVMGNFSQYSSRYDQVLAGERPNIFNPDFAGGCLMDINFYNLYLNVALFGKPINGVYYPNIYPGLSDSSGSLILQYDGFISQNAGAKDTWGVNFFQIEGEQGYIYATTGPAALEEIRVVTKTEETVYNGQQNDRWYYEVTEVAQRLLNEDFETFNSRLEIMLAVIETLETVRKKAGIYFPGD